MATTAPGQDVSEPFLQSRSPAATTTPSSSTKRSEIAVGEPLSHGPARPSGPGHRLAYFWMRTAVVVLVPVTITAFYLWIWLYCLRESSPAKYAAFDQVWIYYMWFLIGVFGLDISRHGLLGVEAAMLQAPFWKARSAMVVLMHSGATWSGPGDGAPVFGTVMPFAAFPLSGLTMELADGWVPVKTPATVVGRTWADFNLRKPYQTVNRGIAAWANGLPARLPGIGLVYTPPYVPRDQYVSLASFPNSLPAEGQIPGLFLAPQAETPVGGRTWGLLVGYNCSVVESASEFTILRQKSSSATKVMDGLRAFAQTAGQKTLELSISSASNSSINVFNLTIGLETGRNLWAYAEMGLSRRPVLGYDGTEYPFADQESTASGEADILEYALWQVRLNASYPEADEMIAFNDSTRPSIAGMGHPFVRQPDGKYAMNRTFFAWGHDLASGPSNDNIESYANGSQSGREAERVHLLRAIPSAPVQRQHHGDGDVPLRRRGSPHPRGPVPRALHLGERAPPLAYSNSVAYRNFVQPKTLLEAVMRAHAVDALQLMYDGVGTMDGARLDPNLTATQRGKILERGRVPAEVAAVLFLVWAAGCLALGLGYGFRRRWSATLDGYSLFRFGADLADELRGAPGFSSVAPFDQCNKLSRLPGLVGDSAVEFDVGHVGLVESSNVANPRKVYD
ncbi:hypothetical protein ACCO45_012412 [Purpureocillium lilacinum]|uniref:Uncharacterized protein n=1 Tax=Purpureocillium lilacinum TaxID=33203 RepID=A0ACC4DA23_PURLI